jgi:hypothetical protein
MADDLDSILGEHLGAPVAPGDDLESILGTHLGVPMGSDAAKSMTHEASPDDAKMAGRAASPWGFGHATLDSFLLGGLAPSMAMGQAMQSDEPGNVFDKYTKEREKIKVEQDKFSAREGVLGGLATTVPGLLPTVAGIALGQEYVLGPAARALGSILPKAASVAGRVGGQVLSGATRGAAEGAEAGALQSQIGGADESVGSQAAKSALVGGVLGGAGKPIVDALFGSSITPRTASLAQNAIRQGVPLPASSIPGAPNVAALARKAFGGTSDAELRDGLTRAVSRTMGQNSDLTDFAARQIAQRDTGHIFDVAGQNTSAKIDKPLIQGFSDIQNEVQGSTVEHQDKVNRAIDSVIRNFIAPPNSMEITGETLKRMRKGGELGTLLNSTDSTSRYYGARIMGELQQSLARNSPPDMVDLLSRANQQWKNIMIAEGATDEASGKIDPTKLLKATEKHYGTSSAAKAGDIGVLAQVADTMIKGAPKAAKRDPGFLQNIVHSPYTAAVGAGGLAGEAAEHAGALTEHASAAVPAAALAAAALARGHFHNTVRGTSNLLDRAISGQRSLLSRVSPQPIVSDYENRKREGVQ